MLAETKPKDRQKKAAGIRAAVLQGAKECWPVWKSKHTEWLEQFIDRSCRLCSGSGMDPKHFVDTPRPWVGIVVGPSPDGQLSFGDIVQLESGDLVETYWAHNPWTFMGLPDQSRQIAFCDKEFGLAIPHMRGMALVFTFESELSGKIGTYFTDVELESAVR